MWMRCDSVDMYTVDSVQMLKHRINGFILMDFYDISSFNRIYHPISINISICVLPLALPLPTYTHRRFEGLATLVTPRVKSLETPVIVVVLTDCLLFLQEQSQKYTFFAPDTKAGVVSLQKLLIREKAGESRSIYIISTDTNYPEMYELKVQQPKDKTEWIKTIR